MTFHRVDELTSYSEAVRKRRTLSLGTTIKGLHERTPQDRNASTNLNALAASISHAVPKLSYTGIGSEDQTQSKPCFSSCNELGGEDLKQQPLCQDGPKDVLSDSGLEIELAIPFVPNRDPPDTPQQSELGEVVHYHPIRMKSLPTAAAYGRTYGSRISSRYLRPVTVPPWNTCRSVWPPSEIPCPNQDSTTSITVSFNSVGLMVSVCCSLQIQ
ncbi:uncharacterized protein TNCV_3298491 [Trichonephila clavipes]|uniref:Uncharacterized protein n=1 Tax=Trichonephila clavipes TaxID=2585209 RepID=A0A8X6VTL8_TRICX|nr:uncharacterized protein TNCV_3298491 [Trichonephila clavipes]